MFKKLGKMANLHIYVFGILANLLPIIGLMVVYIPLGLNDMHPWQITAWICGGIYYVFMWSVAMIAYRKLKTKNKTLEERVEALENKSS